MSDLKIDEGKKNSDIGRKFQELPNSFTEGRKLTDLSSDRYCGRSVTGVTDLSDRHT